MCISIIIIIIVVVVNIVIIMCIIVAIIIIIIIMIRGPVTGRKAAGLQVQVLDLGLHRRGLGSETTGRLR